MPKVRVDVLLVERNLVPSRETAKKLIMAGLVYSEGFKIDKPGETIDSELPLFIKNYEQKYVSRGGYKLEKALEEFDLNLDSRVMLDIGSSTGGFTDCGLQNGIQYGYALDVGTNQLDYRIRSNDKVFVMEKTNFRYVTKDAFDHTINFVSIDVSFISLRLIFQNLCNIVDANTDVVALIKPQFEVGREHVTKGIIVDPKLQILAIQKVIDAGVEFGFGLQGLTYSPIKGQKGNIEFLAHFIFKKDAQPLDIEACVEGAHRKLKEE